MYNLNKQLPIRLDADITTDCWNFYRMAVVNAHSYVEPFLLNRFNHLYMNTSREIHYGLSLYKTNPNEAYSAVMDTLCKPLADIQTSNDFVDCVLDNIIQGVYPLFECDYNVLHNISSEGICVHECLVCGIEKDCFVLPLFYNRNWCLKKIPVDLVTKAFFSRKSISIEQRIQYAWRREYLAPFTLLRINPKPQTHIHPYEFYYDICRILERTCFENRLVEEGKPRGKEYSGVLAVYNGILEILNDIIKGEFDLLSEKYQLELNIKRLYEYAKLFYKHIRYYEKLVNKKFPSEIFRNIETIIDRLNLTFLIAIKYSFNKNQELLFTLSDIFCDVFHIHHEMLEIMEMIIRTRMLE